jgi:large subunit ribosomal protein L15
MPHRLRKIRKKRGTRTVGYGRVSQHRGGGQRGGHGKAGRHKHLWSYVLRYEPDYFEKKGFRPRRRPGPNVINVNEIDADVHRLLDEGKAFRKADGIHIDLQELGYDKLLGAGKVTHPLLLRVDSFSKSAAEKINKAKGRILPTGERTTPANLTAVMGIGPKRSGQLQEVGINSVEALAGCETEDLAEKLGTSETIVSKWIKNANELL